MKEVNPYAVFKILLTTHIVLVIALVWYGLTLPFPSEAAGLPDVMYQRERWLGIPAYVLQIVKVAYIVYCSAELSLFFFCNAGRWIFLLTFPFAMPFYDFTFPQLAFYAWTQGCFYIVVSIDLMLLAYLFVSPLRHRFNKKRALEGEQALDTSNH